MKPSAQIWEEAQDETLSHLQEMHTGDWGEALEMLTEAQRKDLLDLSIKGDECAVGKLVIMALTKYRDYWDEVNYNAHSDEWDGE